MLRSMITMGEYKTSDRGLRFDHANKLDLKFHSQTGLGPCCQCEKHFQQNLGNPTENRGLIELAQSGGTQRHLSEQYGSTCLCGNPRRRLNLQLGAFGSDLASLVPCLGDKLGVEGL